MNRKIKRVSIPTPKELNMNKIAYYPSLFMFNSFGVGENLFFIYLFMFNPFRIVGLKKDMANGQNFELRRR
jgi:hypothetical protein